MPERNHRSGSRYLAAVLAVIALLAVSAPAGAAMRAARASYPKAIERLASYQPQKYCSPTAKPGTVDLSRRLLRAYPGTRSLGIVRACRVGGRSEHKEGRAFDWGGLRASKAADRKKVAAATHWLLKTDRHGNRYAMARRLGVMYLIWNKRIWSASRPEAGWRRYTGANPHTDHMHISMSRRAARKETSFWTGRPAAGTTAPPPGTSPRPAPPPAGSTSNPRPEPRPASTLPSGPALEDETLRLPANASGGKATTGALTRGQPYLLEISGSYRYTAGSGTWADAECSRTKADPTWRRDRSVHRAAPWSDHLDLYVDGADLYAEADSDTGNRCDTRSHTYRWMYTPSRSGRVTFKLWEPGAFSDNTGSLTIRVIRSTPRDELTWQVPARNRTGATSPGALQGGATYVATVTGTVSAGGGVTSDAECSATTSDATWRRNRSVLTSSPTADHLDMLVDRDDTTFDPAVDTGGTRCDQESHTYRTVLRPQQTRPVNLRIDDPAPGDNSGALQVSLVRVRPVSGTETVSVDTASASGATTARVYPAGQSVRLRVSGGYAFGPGVWADAECTATTGDPVWRSARQQLVDARGQLLGDLRVNGRTLDWHPATGDGRCDPSTHTYLLDYTQPETGPVVLSMADDNLANNSGVLTVTVTPNGLGA